MPTLKIFIVDPPAECAGYGRISHKLQLKKGFLEPSEPNIYVTEFELVDGIPKGDIVHYNSDKRRFIYIQWISQQGQMFRRIKLFFEHFLQEGTEYYDVKINGTLKDGTPACATTRPIP